MDVARYHFICSGHGACGSAPIEPTKRPTTRKCPVCAEPTEVWVGAHEPSSHRGGEQRLDAWPRAG